MRRGSAFPSRGKAYWSIDEPQRRPAADRRLGARSSPSSSLEDAAPAVPLARALVAGGLPVIEITLRTGAALAAIEAIAGEVEGAIVGAGTVLSKGQLVAAARAGARSSSRPASTPIS